MEKLHGGDIYQQEVTWDFSVNVNPLGMPKGLQMPKENALTYYPEANSGRLKKALAERLSAFYESDIDEGHILMGNGASELFMAIVHGLKPQKILLPVPSFLGYAWVSEACGSEIIPYVLKEEDEFALTYDFLEALTPDIDLLFLANPNNPTGQPILQPLLDAIPKKCQKQGIIVALDECFTLLSDESTTSILPNYKEFSNVILVRAFTKSFGAPGLRLGYLVCENDVFREKVKSQLPEWNVSTIAQVVGLQILNRELKEYLQQTRKTIKEERDFLTSGLRNCGMQVYPSATNFILFQSKISLKEALLSKGILIRDCSNFVGLEKGYYRIAVKRREENEILLQEIRKICGET